MAERIAERKVWQGDGPLTTSYKKFMHRHTESCERATSAHYQCLVDLTMKAWNPGVRDFCFNEGWPVKGRWNNIKGGEICEKLHSASANELKSAIRKFEDERCILGLVLIAGLAEGYERHEAVNALLRLTLNLGGNKKPIKRICDMVPLKNSWNGKELVLETAGKFYVWHPLPDSLIG